MVRTRRESHHCNGITDPKRLQPSFATKSAQSGHSAVRRKALSAFARTGLAGEGADQTTMSGFGGEPSAFCESAYLTEVSLAQESRVESRVALRGN